jgi:hypothetical protein
MQAPLEQRLSAKSLPRSFAPHDDARGERRSASRGAAYAAHAAAYARERFGPTYGCVEWFMYEEVIPAPQTSCD